MFRECGICCFSIRFLNCSDSVVFVVFLLDIGAVPTVRYCFFLLDIGADPTVRYLFFSVRYWSCSDSAVFEFFC